MTDGIRAILDRAADPGRTVVEVAAVKSRGHTLRLRRRLLIVAATTLTVALFVVAAVIRDPLTRESRFIAPVVSDAPSTAPVPAGPLPESMFGTGSDDPDPGAGTQVGPRPESEPAPDGRAQERADDCPSQRSDPAGDVSQSMPGGTPSKNRSSVDVVNVRLGYERPRNSLVFTYGVVDFVEPPPGEAASYILAFGWAGYDYYADARIDEVGETSFRVYADKWLSGGELHHKTQITKASGAFDATADIVTFVLSLDDFNAGEPDAADLTEGSALTKVRLETEYRPVGAGSRSPVYMDSLHWLCAYTIG